MTCPPILPNSNNLFCNQPCSFASITRGIMGILRRRIPVAANIVLPIADVMPTLPVSPAPAEERSQWFTLLPRNTRWS